MKKFTCVLVTPIVLILFCTSMVAAATITFDDPIPSDVTVQYFNYSFGTSPITTFPTAISEPLQFTNSAVPGGQQALLLYQSGTPFGPYGALFSFSSAQSAVSMIGNDFGGDPTGDNEIVFLSAFGTTKDYLGYTTLSTTYAVPDLKNISINFPEMYYVAFTWNVDLGYYSVDNVEYSSSAVPEPATMVLLGLGLIGLGVCGKKRFKK